MTLGRKVGHYTKMFKKKWEKILEWSVLKRELRKEILKKTLHGFLPLF